MIHLLRRVLAVPVLLAVAVLLQVSLINRLPLPGNAGPGLVILVVAALAVSGGPVKGMIAGFLGGLALDIAPPGSDLVGESALVCCVVGYGCGALAAWRPASGAGAHRTTPDGRVVPVTPFTAASASGMWQGAARQSRLRALPLMASGAVAGEVLQAGLGMLLSDPSTTMPAVRNVLPAAVTYDLLLSPLVLVLVAVVARGAAEPGTAGYAAATVVLATPVAVTRVPAAFRSADAAVGLRRGGVPRLSFADTRPAAIRAPARQDPKLKFAAGNGPSSSRTGSPGPRASHPGRPGAGSWSGGSASGPRGSAWLRDGGQRGAARRGAPSTALPSTALPSTALPSTAPASSAAQGRDDRPRSPSAAAATGSSAAASWRTAISASAGRPAGSAARSARPCSPAATAAVAAAHEAAADTVPRAAAPSGVPASARAACPRAVRPGAARFAGAAPGAARSAAARWPAGPPGARPSPPGPSAITVPGGTGCGKAAAVPAAWGQGKCGRAGWRVPVSWARRRGGAAALARAGCGRPSPPRPPGGPPRAAGGCPASRPSS